MVVIVAVGDCRGSEVQKVYFVEENNQGLPEGALAIPSAMGYLTILIHVSSGSRVFN